MKSPKLKKIAALWHWLKLPSSLLVLCLLTAVIFTAGYVLQRGLDQKQKSNLDYLALARQASFDQNLDRAEEYYLKAVSAADGDKTIWRELAGVYYKEGKKEEAIKAYSNSLENAASDASPLNSIANLHRELRQFDQAEQAYLRSLDHNPNYLTAVTNLANLYELMGKDSQSTALLEKYYDGSRMRSNIGLQLAGIYKLSGRTTEAKRVAETVLKTDPDSEAAKSLLSRL